jgi:hypothetical protein
MAPAAPPVLFRFIILFVDAPEESVRNGGGTCRFELELLLLLLLDKLLLVQATAPSSGLFSEPLCVCEVEPTAGFLLSFSRVYESSSV